MELMDQINDAVRTVSRLAAELPDDGETQPRVRLAAALRAAADEIHPFDQPE